MPLTDLAKAELDSESFYSRYGSNLRNAPADEAEAQRRRDKAEPALLREAAYATSPEHGELFDLEQREHSITVTTDSDRLSYLRRKLRPFFSPDVEWDSRRVGS